MFNITYVLQLEKTKKNDNECNDAIERRFIASYYLSIRISIKAIHWKRQLEFEG